MPELPEIETIKRDLEKKIVGKTIARVEVREKKSRFLQTEIEDPRFRKTKSGPVSPSPKKFAKILTGNQFKKIERRGKLLIFQLAAGQFLLAHMKMTGQLVYRYDHKTIYGGHDVPKTVTVLPNQFTRVIFSFKDKSVLYFNDMRKFGYLKIVSAEEKEKILATRFGPDAWSPKPSFKIFKEILHSRAKSTLKAVLMDQQSIVGIGNIYADEICFMAKLRPQRKVNTLTSLDIKKLYNSMNKVLAHAIKHRGTTFGTRPAQNYVDSAGEHGNYLDFLKVYRRDGKPCLRCKKSVIQKDNTAGRGTRFCPVCQK